MAEQAVDVFLKKYQKVMLLSMDDDSLHVPTCVDS